MIRLGIDLGGTNIAVGVVDENFNIIGFSKSPTDPSRTSKEIINSIVDTSLMAIKDSRNNIDKIDFIGIGTPGSVNPITGVVENSANLPFDNLNLSKELEKFFGKKVFVENDANAAAYGEYIAGSGKDTNNFVAVTLGTGIGSGVIIDNRLFHGSNFGGGEIGHFIISSGGVKCSCGRRGCFEAYASATALINQTKAAMKKAPNSLLWEFYKRENIINGKTVFAAAKEGDETAKKVIDKYIQYLGDGILTIISVFQPQRICIGGGISNERDNLLIPLKRYIERCDSLSKASKNIDICIATLGNNAGIIGAAFLDTLYS